MVSKIPYSNVTGFPTTSDTSQMLALRTTLATKHSEALIVGKWHLAMASLGVVSALNFSTLLPESTDESLLEYVEWSSKIGRCQSGGGTRCRAR